MYWQCIRNFRVKIFQPLYYIVFNISMLIILYKGCILFSDIFQNVSCYRSSKPFLDNRIPMNSGLEVILITIVISVLVEIVIFLLSTRLGLFILFIILCCIFMSFWKWHLKKGLIRNPIFWIDWNIGRQVWKNNVTRHIYNYSNLPLPLCELISQMLPDVPNGYDENDELYMNQLESSTSTARLDLLFNDSFLFISIVVIILVVVF